MSYVLPTQLTVGCFLFCGDEVLMLKRNENKDVDPGLLCYVGGRVEFDEDAYSGVIREVKEEMGFDISHSNIKLVSVMSLHTRDMRWMNLVFSTNIDSKDIPKKDTHEDGVLLWMNKRELMNYEKIVEDIPIIFPHVIDGKVVYLQADYDNNYRMINHTLSVV